MCRSLRTRGTLVVLLALSFSPAALAQYDDLSPAERDRLFAEIDQEVKLLERQGNLLKKVVRVVQPSVVHIDVKKTDAGGVRLSRPVEEAGSGVIIFHKEKHYVITNRHVVKDAQLANITVKLADGRQLTPLNQWANAETDIAVLSIRTEGLVPARLGDSRRVEIGDFVLAVGSPFGLSHSVTYGIISAKARRDLQLGTEGVRLQNFFQTDAAINPGNSGGPLLNLRGEVIGINTAIASNSGGNDGIGFSIPIETVMNVATQLIDQGTFVRSFLGVQLDSRFTPESAARLGLPQPRGARVNLVTPDSPAEKANLQVGDVILMFDGIVIEDDTHLVNLVGLTPDSSVVPMVVFRRGQTLNVQVTVRAK